MDNNNLYFDISTANLEVDHSESEFRALPNDVKDNYIFNNYSAIDALVGTMPINAPGDIKINPKFGNISDNEYVIPLGYHDGTGKVYVGDLSEYTYGTATPEDVANNKTFWVNGERKVGLLNMEGLFQEATASSVDIVENRTAWVNGEKIEGTIPILPRRDKTLLAGQSYTFPYGLSSGTSIISSASLSSQTIGTATASDIIASKIAWVNGEEIAGTLDIENFIIDRFQDTNVSRNQVLAGKKFYSNQYQEVSVGSMPDHTGEGVRYINIGEPYYIPEGYYNGLSYVATKTLAEATVSDARPTHILSNKTAWVNGEKIIGSMPYNVESIIELSAGNTYTIPMGYHSGVGKIVCKSIDHQTEGTASASDIIKSKTAWVNGEKITGTLLLTGDATVDTVLSGKTFYSSSPHILNTGTMFNHAAISRQLSAGESFTIPKGYHNGNGVISTKSLAEQTASNVSPQDILINKTCWSNGIEIEGLMPDNQSVSRLLSPGESFSIPIGYHNGNGVITAPSIDSQTQGTATVSDISYGKTAWVNGSKLVGTLPRLPGQNRTLLAGESYTIPYGISQGNIVINSENLDTQTVGTATSNDILNEKTAWVNGQEIIGEIPTRNNNFVRLPVGHNINLPPGYYPNGIVIYSIYEGDRLDLTGTDAYIFIDSLYPNDSGYISEDKLIITAEFSA